MRRVRNLKFAMNLKFTTSKTLVNFMKKMMFLSKNWYCSVQKTLIYYRVNKSHHNSFILLVFSHVANFRYVANFRFLTLQILQKTKEEALHLFHNTDIPSLGVWLNQGFCLLVWFFLSWLCACAIWLNISSLSENLRLHYFEFCS